MSVGTVNLELCRSSPGRAQRDRRIRENRSGTLAKGRTMVDVVTDAMTDSDRDRAQSYVVFRLGGEGYALEVMRVQEVLDVQALTEVPGSPKSLLGVINLRGHVVPVYDLRIPFGLTSRRQAGPGPQRPDRRDRAGQRRPGDGPAGGPGLRRPGVLARGGATFAAAWTWEDDPVRPRADPSPGRLLARTGCGSGLLGPRRR